MPKTVSEKCRLCAKLTATEAIAKHGGTGCWEGDKCHKRRTYYRNRDLPGIEGNTEPLWNAQRLIAKGG